MTRLDRTQRRITHPFATRVDLALDKAFVIIDRQDPYRGMSLRLPLNAIPNRGHRRRALHSGCLCLRPASASAAVNLAGTGLRAPGRYLDRRLSSKPRSEER